MMCDACDGSTWSKKRWRGHRLMLGLMDQILRSKIAKNFFFPESSFVYQEPSGITDASWALLRYICVRRVRWSIFFPPHVMFFGIPDLIFVSSVRSNSLNCSLGVHCTVHLFSTLMSQSMFELQRQDVQIVVVSPAGARPWARRL